MALQVGNFTTTGSGSTISYSLSWVGFDCGGGTRSISMRLFDINRNAVVELTNFASRPEDGSLSGSFTNVYRGSFRILALFICSNVGTILISQGPTVDITLSSGIDAPDPGDSGDPDPVTDDPNAPSSEAVCIPTTGAVSMGDLNVIFGRDRTLANTLLSGPNNPSTAPSLFGISFLPSTGTISKSTPNAISEFRGYCHVEPIQAITVSYEAESPGSEPGRIIIDYFALNGTSQQVNRTVSGGGFVIGTFNVKPGTNVTVTVENDAVSPTGAEISVFRDASLIVNQTGNPSALVKFVVNQVNAYDIIGTIGTSGGGGGGPI